MKHYLESTESVLKEVEALVFVSVIQFILNKLITYNEKVIKSDNK